MRRTFNDSEIVRDRNVGGFTLLEAIVALVLFSSILISLQSGFARGARSIRVADHESQALQLARSIIESAGSEIALGDDRHVAGISRGKSWELTMSRYTQPRSTKVYSNIERYWLEVTVQWREAALEPSRAVKLKTLKYSVAP